MAQSVIDRLNQRAGDVLDDNEHFHGAQGMTVKGRNALASWAADVELADALPNFVAAHGVVDELQVADDTIPNAFLAAVTDRRVLVFSRSITGKPKELVETFELETCTLDVVDTGERARARIFVFGTPEGTVFAGECPINGKALDSADAFVAAWQEVADLN